MHRPARLLVPLLGLLTLVPAQRAGAQSISFGVLAGASLSTFTGGSILNDAKQYAGYVVGGFVRVGVMGFALQPGIYYSVKGVKSSQFTGETDGKTSIEYIQIPLVLRIKLPGHLYVGAGPSLGIKTGCKSSTASAGSIDCAAMTTVPTLKSTEISGIAEAGLEFGKIALGLRADLGLTNALEAAQSGSTANLGVKTRTVSAVVMYRF